MIGRGVRAVNLAALAATLAFAPSAPIAAQPALTIRYPYVAALSRGAGAQRVYFCGGTLVAPRWILTAAHCFRTRGGQSLAPSDLWALVGQDRLAAAGPDHQVAIERIIVHPSYDPAAQANDLALVRLREEAGTLIADPDAGYPAPPGRATILGYGSFFEGGLAGRAFTARGSPAAQLSDRIHRASVRLLGVERCAERVDIGAAYGGASRLCATGHPDTACAGDSGGPLVAEAAEGPDRVIGIVSYGSGCAVPSPVIIYTRVAAYSDWIAATLAAE